MGGSSEGTDCLGPRLTRTEGKWRKGEKGAKKKREDKVVNGRGFKERILKEKKNTFIYQVNITGEVIWGGLGLELRTVQGTVKIS